MLSCLSKGGSYLGKDISESSFDSLLDEMGDGVANEPNERVLGEGVRFLEIMLLLMLFPSRPVN